jgi:hypothetical protein
MHSFTPTLILNESCSDPLIRKAITYCAVYNNNWSTARQKYILTSNSLYTHYHINIGADKLKLYNHDIATMVVSNEALSVTPQKQDELRVRNNLLIVETH